jgi:hypothetical protein
MDDHNELLFARLEEQVLDVAEEDIWASQLRDETAGQDSPILLPGPSGRKRIPFVWISRLPSDFLPSGAGRGNTFFNTYG